MQKTSLTEVVFCLLEFIGTLAKAKRVIGRCAPVEAMPGEAEKLSGSRNADGSSWRRRHDCISRRASRAVGLSVALTVDNIVLGRILARKDLGRPPLPSCRRFMTILPDSLSVSVEM